MAMNRPTAPAADELEAWRRRGSRYTAIVFVTLASAFIVLSTYQLAVGVFGDSLGFAPLREPMTLGECTRSLAAMSTAVDRATASASRAPDDAAAVVAFEGALAPEWDDPAGVERLCAEDPRGRDAFAAVLRFRIAGQGFARRGAIQLAPLRRDVAAYLRSPPPP